MARGRKAKTSGEVKATAAASKAEELKKRQFVEAQLEDNEDSESEAGSGVVEESEDETEGAYLRKVAPGKATDPRFHLSDDEDDEAEAEDEIEDTISESVEQHKQSLKDGSDEDRERQTLEGEESAASDEDEDMSDDEVAQVNLNDFLTPQSLTATSSKPLTAKSLAKLQAKIAASGVVYLSRVPPFMRPIKLRQLLSKYGTIGRIYLAPEDPKIAARRKKYRKNKRQNYTEGWIEFEDKKVARVVAQHLNGKQLGGKKRNFYYDDLWNLKYLPRFKWNNLTEQIAYELKVREQRLKTEMAHAKRENKAYLKNVGKAKMVEALEQKKADKKRKAEADAGGDSGAGGTQASGDAAAAASQKEIRRRFKQRKVIDAETRSSTHSTGKTSNVLSKLFG